MPKKIRNCFYKNLTFEKLMEAHKRARKHKSYRKDVILFEIDLENNIVNLLNKIKNGTYRLGNYKSFLIYEPKERTIESLPYIDRIVHQWYVEEFIKPYIIPRFVNTSFACLEDKGTHKAVEQVEKYLRIFKRNYGDFWILKCDVKRFFYSIDPNILLNIMQKYIYDEDLFRFTKLLIFDGRKPNSIGIPIGNYTSQFFANIYLNELDQYIKRVLHVKYFVRYMDDFIILLKNKRGCKEIKNKISIFLNEHLHLELNSKSRYYPYKMGVNFCGYRIFTTYKLLRNSSKKKIKRNVSKWNKAYNNKTLDINKAMQSLNSWVGHSSHCNSYRFQKKIFNACDFLYTDNTYNSIEKNIISDMKNCNLSSLDCNLDINKNC